MATIVHMCLEREHDMPAARASCMLHAEPCTHRIHGVHVSPSIQQRLHHLRMALRGSHMQRGAACLRKEGTWRQDRRTDNYTDDCTDVQQASKANDTTGIRITKQQSSAQAGCMHCLQFYRHATWFTHLGPCIHISPACRSTWGMLKRPDLAAMCSGV